MQYLDNSMKFTCLAWIYLIYLNLNVIQHPSEKGQLHFFHFVLLICDSVKMKEYNLSLISNITYLSFHLLTNFLTNSLNHSLTDSLTQLSIFCYLRCSVQKMQWGRCLSGAGWRCQLDAESCVFNGEYPMKWCSWTSRHAILSRHMVFASIWVLPLMLYETWQRNNPKLCVCPICSLPGCSTIVLSPGMGLLWVNMIGCLDLTVYA